MEKTSVLRYVDDLGRVVIPKEIRKKFNIWEGDAVEIYVEKDKIILKPYKKWTSVHFYFYFFKVLSTFKVLSHPTLSHIKSLNYPPKVLGKSLLKT